MNTRSTKLLRMFLLAGLLLACTMPVTTAVAKEPAHSTTQPTTKPSYPILGPGLTYIQERFGDEPLSVYILKIDRAQNTFAFVTTLAQGKLFGLEPMSSQASHIPASVGQPIAAINGDFFAIKEGPYQGTICGTQIYGDQIISDPTGPTFWIDPEGKPQIQNVTSNFQITWPNGTTTPFELNNNRAEGKAVLYTPILGESTRTQGGVEYVLQTEGAAPLKAGEVCKAKVLSVSTMGNSPLQPGTMVLSIGPKLAPSIPTINVNDQITISTASTPSLKDVRLAIAGNEILLHEGKIQKFPDKDRHPRTAFGWDDKSFYFVVVDGRQKGLSRGMDYEELAQLMQQVGAKEAMNFDGGGSSTLWINGYIMNSPSDGHERAVANGLVLLRVKAPATEANPQPTEQPKAAESQPQVQQQPTPQAQPQTSIQPASPQIAQPQPQVVQQVIQQPAVVVQQVPVQQVVIVQQPVLPPPVFVQPVPVWPFPSRVIVAPRPCPPCLFPSRVIVTPRSTPGPYAGRPLPTRVISAPRSPQPGFYPPRGGAPGDRRDYRRH